MAGPGGDGPGNDGVTAVLMIADNAPGGPQRVAMTGQGASPSIPSQEDKPSRAVGTTSVTGSKIERLRQLDTLRLDPNGWCCGGGNVFSGSGRTCALKQGAFYPTQDAAQRACSPVIR